MKKVVAFLLCVLIFVAPVTTYVKADVVIGDNDHVIITENATVLGRKLALLESFSDLALSGITDYTISNTNDVDSYLDYLWEELNDAIDSLSDGTGFTEISNSLKSKYFTNLVQYKDYINNRGNYLAQLLPTGNPTTTLLSTFFADNIFGKQYTEHYDLALDMFRSLSALNNQGPQPNPNPDFSFITNINNIFIPNSISFTQYPKSTIQSASHDPVYNLKYDINDLTFTCSDFVSNQSHLSTATLPNNGLKIWAIYPKTTIYVNTNQDETVSVTYSNNTNVSWTYNEWESNSYSMNLTRYDSETGDFWGWYNYQQQQYVQTFLQSEFVGLSSAINYIYQHYANINLYVDGELWVLSSTPNNDTTLDIDGFIKIFGNDYPQQYQLQPNTKIDYDQLYQVIYNAIRDNLPISQGDINYYDSHDTIYSPTIINNYGEEEGNESDLIDTILDYAVIPKFDTAIAQPMRKALTNGVVIMNNSITNVIPNEILLILGACFFLLLFAVVINRMIK